MRRGLLVGSVCAVFAAGAAASAPPAGVLGVATYMQGPGDFGFEASRFVRLDARLRPRPGGLRLGDGMTSSVPSPDRRMFAVGTANFGEIVVVDPAKLRRVATTYTVGRSPRLNYETRVVNWPRPHLLVALVSPAPGKYPVASALLLCDPLRGKVLREIPFGGGADGLAAGDFSAFLVGALRGIVPQRVVVVDPAGRIRSVRLRRIPAGYVPPNRTRPYTRTVAPALATSPGRAIVLGTGETVASIGLRSLRATYHRVAGLWGARHLAGVWPNGTVGPERSKTRLALRVGAHELLVEGSDKRAGPPRWLEHDVVSAPALLDTRTWTLAHVFRGVSALSPVGQLLLGGPPNGRFMTAFRHDGSSAYRIRSRWWEVVAGRLVAGDPFGKHLVELDPRTGRRIRVLGPAPYWPFDVLAWRR